MQTVLGQDMMKDFNQSSLHEIMEAAKFRSDLLKSRAECFKAELSMAKQYLADADKFMMLAHSISEILAKD